ncbi:hypothetical protein [Roseateles violae]|uniref:Transmembrane protein n=1 Tax=Roseateles violae TaxID=3058042 RepID=A0ABT8DW74_9BURK|nr:hypothetical protein [Pelomonas sp. PFR6]MDN3922510.1 hypothetical protein [Pelomonas sp. PFR6]
MAADQVKADAGPSLARKYSHYEVAYIKLRTSMAVLAILLPVSLAFVSYIVHDYGFQPSISHYYIAGDFERNLLVGMLSCIGVFLMLYEGYSTLENRVLDVGGFLLVCVAFFPLNLTSFVLWGHTIQVQWELGPITLSVHGLTAVGFFICMIYVSTVLSGQTLRGRGNNVRCKWLLRYWLVSAVMAVAMVVALLGHQIQGSLFHKRAVFWVESIGVVAFAIFWLMKTREVNPTVSYRLKIFAPLSTAAKETTTPADRLQELGPPALESSEAVGTEPSSLCAFLRRLQGALGADSDVGKSKPEHDGSGKGLVPDGVQKSS